MGQAFAAVAILQTLAAGAVLKRLAWIRPVAIAGTVVLVVAWVVSRSVGLPVGAHPWIPEPVGTADLVAASLHLGLIACLVRGFDGQMRARRDLRSFADIMSIAIVPVVGIVAILTLIAIGSLVTTGANHGHT